MPEITSPTLFLILTAVLSYLLGAIPFGLVITRAMGLGDLRKIGSGNIGATNVLRTGRKGLAAGTLVLDALKGTAAVIIGGQLIPGGELLGAVGAFYGHLLPVWLRFKGGKGVATAVGVLFGFSVWLALAALATWLFMAFVVKISSLSAIVACVLVPVYAYFIVGPQSVYFGTCIIIAILVVHRHKSNLVNLLTGTEDKIGKPDEQGKS